MGEGTRELYGTGLGLGAAEIELLQLPPGATPFAEQQSIPFDMLIEPSGVQTVAGAGAGTGTGAGLGTTGSGGIPHT